MSHAERDFCGLVLVFLAVPDVPAEDPEGGGVEHKPGDEDQEIEVRVHGLDSVLPVGHVVATWRGGRVGHSLRPLSMSTQSHLDRLRYPNKLRDKRNDLNHLTEKEFLKKKSKKAQ